jgi:hypothetical protein
LKTLKRILLSTLSIVNGTTLALTFSEGITDGAGTTDFKVKVNGADVTGTTAYSASGNKVTFTLGSALPTLTTPISVEVQNTNDLVDGAGNVVAAKTITLN